MTDAAILGGMAKTAPRVGDIVFYQSYGTPQGEYESLGRAAVVTQVNSTGEDPSVGLCVLNPTGMFFNPEIEHDDSETPAGGTWRRRPMLPTFEYPGDGTYPRVRVYIGDTEVSG